MSREVMMESVWSKTCTISPRPALSGDAETEIAVIGAGGGGYSFRKYGDLLLLGGGGHRTGEKFAGERYEELRTRAAMWFPGSREAAHWSAQDCMTADGAVHAVDIRCPHLGCQLEWNPDEKSWDCPCHGSRFDFRGNLISGPAQNEIKG